MPQWSAVQKRELVQALEACGEGQWIDAVIDWDDTVPSDEPELVSALAAIGIKQASLAAVALVVATVAATEPSTMPRPPSPEAAVTTTRTDPTSSSDGRTDEFDIISDVRDDVSRARPFADDSSDDSAVTDSDSDTGCGAVEQLTFETVVQAVNDASTGARNVQEDVIVALAGPTGAGKSTLRHFLHGDVLCVRGRAKGRNCQRIDVEEGPSRIGHDCSCTKEPETHRLDDTVTTVDLPGGSDTGGRVVQLRNGVMNALVLSPPGREVRLVLVLPFDIIEADRGGSLMRHLEDFEALFENIPDALQGVRIVVSRLHKRWDLDKYERLSQREAAERVLTTIEPLMRRKHTAGGQLLGHMHDGLRETAFRCQGPDARFGWCMVFNPLDAASRPAMVEAIVGGAPVRGPPGCRAFRPSLPHDVAVEIDGMLRAARDQFDTDLGAGDARAAAQHLSKVTTVMGVLGEVGLLPQHRDLPQRMALSASRHINDEQPDLLRRVNEGDAHGVAAALERIGVMSDALGVAVRAAAPTAPCMTRAEALVLCEEQVTRGLSGETTVADASMVLLVASASLAVARILDTSTTRAAADDFTRRLESAVKDAVVAMTATHAFEMAARYSKILTAVQEWSSVLPTLVEYRSVARHAVVSTVRDIISRAQGAVHDGASGGVGLQKALEALNDCAGCGDLRSIVVDDVDVLGERDAVHAVLEVESTVVDDSDAPAVVGAAERNRSLLRLDGPNKLDLVRQRSEFRLVVKKAALGCKKAVVAKLERYLADQRETATRMQSGASQSDTEGPPCNYGLQEDDPVFDLLTLAQADTHLGCAHVTTALEACAAKIKATFDLSLGAFQSDLVTPGAYATFVHLPSIMAAPVLPTACDLQELPRGVQAALRSIETTIDTAKERCREFVRSCLCALRDRLPTAEQVEASPYSKTMARTFDDTSAALRLFAKPEYREVCAETRVLLDTAVEGVKQRVTTPLHDDPLSASAAKTVTGCILPLLATSTFRDDGLPEMVAAWLARASEKVSVAGPCRIKALQVLESELRFTTAGQQLCSLDAGCAALCKDAIAKIASLAEKSEQRIIAVRAEAERLNRDAFSSAIALVNDLPPELQEQGADAIVKVASTVMGMIRAAIQEQQLSNVRSDQHAWFMGLRSVMETDQGSHHLRRVTDQWAQLAEFMATESSFIHSALEKALQECDQARIQQCWGQWSSLEVLRDPTAVRRELGAVALEVAKGHCADNSVSIASIGGWVQYLIRWSGMTAIAPQFPQVERWLTDGIADAVKALETGLSQENVADVQRRSEMCRELQELVGSMELGSMKQVVALRPSTQAVSRMVERLSAFDQETGDKIEDHLDHSKFAEAVQELPRLRDHQRADAANSIGVSVHEIISQPTRTASDMQRLRRFVAVGSDPSWRSLRKQAPKFGAAFRDAERQVSEELPAMESALTETVDRLVAALADMTPSSDTWAGLFKAAEECKILELTALNGALSAAAKEYTTTLHRYITGLGKALVAHDVGSLNLKAIATALPYLSCFPEGGLTQLCDSFLKRHHLEKTLRDDLTSSHVDSASADCVAMLDRDVSAAMNRVAFWTTMREHFGASIPALHTGANVEPAVMSWASDKMANAQSNFAASDLAAFHKRFFSVSKCANAARLNGLMGLAAQLDDLMRPLRQTYESDVEQRAAAISSADDTTQTVQSVIVLREMAADAPVLHACVTRAVTSVFERLALTSASFNVFLEQLSAKATEDFTANALTVENEKYFRTAQRKVWKKLHAGASDLTKVIDEFDSEPPLDKKNLLETIKQFSSDLDKHTSECFAKPTMNEVRQAAAQKAKAALQKCRSSLSTKNLRRLLLTVCVTLSAVFSDSHDENERLRLHDAQIIALLRALDVEDTSSFLKAKGDDAVGYLRTLKWVLRGIPNHMVQILTGEGKSYALGVLAAAFALLGARVHVACFSPYLTGRDARALLPLFTLLGVADRVLYRTIDDVCEMHFSNIRDVARHVLETRSFPLSAQQQSSEDDSLPLVLLADEADVLFHLRFFGATFDAGFVLIGPEISALIKEVYDNRGKPYNVRESNALAAVVARYPGTEAVLRVVAQQLVDNSTRYDKAPANEFLWVPEKKRIGYKLAHGDDYDTNVVYPNMTQFAYLQFVEQNICTATDAAPHLGLHLHCGHLSYAHMLASKYELIVGVTGTLKQAPTAVSVPHGVKPGDWILTTEEMKYLRDLFKVAKFSFVPSLYGRSQNKFNDVDVWPLAEWAQKIDAAIDHVSADGAALVFFENDSMLKEFRAGRGKHSDIEAVTEEMPAGTRQGYIANATRKTKVTAFTQAYARGVDFPCRRGALVTVIATYLPATTSEEIQMFGRTARQGREGAVRMILCTEHLQAKFGPLAADLPTQPTDLAISLHELRAQKMKKQDQDREKRLKAALASEKASEAVLNVLRSGIDPVGARHAVCRATIDNNRAANEAFVLVLDSSGSMKDNWPKVINATSGIQELLKRQGRGNTTFIVVLFGDRAQIATRSTAASVKRLRPFQHLGGTNYADAFATAHTEIHQRPNNSVTLLFLTDGHPTGCFDVGAHVGPLLVGERDHLAAFHIVSFCEKEADIPPVLADVKREAERQKVQCVLSNAVDETTLKAHFAATTASNPMHI